MIILLLGCSDSKSPVDSELGYMVVDSGMVQRDTADTVDTTEDTTLIELYPKENRIRVGSEILLRAVAFPTQGPPVDLNSIWTADSEELVTINNQILRANEVGTVNLTAENNYGVQNLQLSIVDDSEITVVVHDALSQTPVSGMTVAVNNEIRGSTDAEGVMVVTSEGLESITVYQQGYIPVSVLSVPGTRIHVPAVPTTQVMQVNNEQNGQIDFSGLNDPDFSDISIALTIPEHRNILSVTLQDLFKSNRTVEIFGTEANVPGSLSIEGYDESFRVYSHLDAPQLSAFAVNAPVSSLADAANGANPFELISPLVPEMIHGMDSENPKPNNSLYPLPAPQISNIPSSFTNNEIVIFHGIKNETGSFQTCGFSVADSANPTVHTSTAQTCNGGMFAAGIFDNSESVVRSSIVETEHEVFPIFLDSPTLQSFDPSNKETVFNFSDGAQIVRVWIQAGDGTQRIIYLPSNLEEITLPTPPFPMGYGNTNWFVQQLHLTRGTYADLLSQSDFSFENIVDSADSSALMRFQLVQ